MEIALGSTFSNARSKYNLRFKELFKELPPNMDEAKKLEEIKVNVSEDLLGERWYLLCNLFNDENWKVNYHKLNSQRI